MNEQAFRFAMDIEAMRFQFAELDYSAAEFYAECVIEGLARGWTLPDGERAEALRAEAYALLLPDAVPDNLYPYNLAVYNA